MFSQVSVCVQGRGGHAWGRGGTCVVKGACMVKGACVAGETATAADGMHPAGMHSCDCIFLPISHSQSQT